MFGTPIAILAAVALLMPGFIVAELALARSAKGRRSDLELALRALVYTVMLHLIFIWWTASLVRKIGFGDDWAHHVGAIALYTVVVLIVAPVLLGSALNWLFARVERSEGPPNRWMAALGVGASRDAFDYAFQQVSGLGAWVVVELVGHSEEPRLVGGFFGPRSAIGQTPQAHDVYLEALCTVIKVSDDLWTLGERVQPERGIYVPAAQIARIELLPAGSDGIVSS
jgi:Family of unknown function (DUF6338)